MMLSATPFSLLILAALTSVVAVTNGRDEHSRVMMRREASLLDYEDQDQEAVEEEQEALEEDQEEDQEDLEQISSRLIKTATHSGWRLIAKQNVTEAFFSNSSLTTFKSNSCPPDSTASTYMTVGLTDSASTSIKFTGSYWFRLVYGNSDGTTSTVQWKQSSWLTETSVSGFQCELPIDCGPANQADAAKQFSGLAKSSNHSVVFSSPSSFWSSATEEWNTVGTIIGYGGMNYIAGWNGTTANTMELYIAETRHMLQDGCSTSGWGGQPLYRPDVAAFDTQRSAAVQCCKKDGTTCTRKWSSGGCIAQYNETKTYEEAVALCDKLLPVGGYRLCETQVEQNKCCSTNVNDCWLDNEMVWTPNLLMPS